MWALCVVLADEVIEADLLLEGIGRCWPGGFLLEGQVHALMPAILLWVAWLDAFDSYAEPEPPDREFREIVEAIGTGKRHAIVLAYGLRQATRPEQGMEGFDDGGLLCALQGLAGQDEA